MAWRPIELILYGCVVFQRKIYFEERVIFARLLMFCVPLEQNIIWN